MGEAKRRAAEIQRLKNATPEEAARQQQIRDDEKLLARGVVVGSRDPGPTAAMARRLAAMLETAKTDGNITPPIEFLHSKVDASLQSLGPLEIACRKGCAHCCHTWVSVTAPEALYVAKAVKELGRTAVDRVLIANEKTRDLNFDARAQRHLPCPLLDGDSCSIYEFRPDACRVAASADAGKCGRAFLGLSSEDVPIPTAYMSARTVYSVAVMTALKIADLPQTTYEMNGALACALQMEDAERAWLSGHDIFENVMRDPGDTSIFPIVERMFEKATGMPTVEKNKG